MFALSDAAWGFLGATATAGLGALSVYFSHGARREARSAKDEAKQANDAVNHRDKGKPTISDEIEKIGQLVPRIVEMIESHTNDLRGLKKDVSDVKDDVAEVKKDIGAVKMDTLIVKLRVTKLEGTDPDTKPDNEGANMTDG